MEKLLNSESLENTWQSTQELILSMTPSEKGYFKKFCRGFHQKEQNHYLQLFDILGKRSPVSDAQIRARMKMQNMNIHSLRNFLYQQILKSLRSYHQEKNVQYTLRAMLDYADILSEKGLHKQSGQFISKGIALSTPETLPAYQILFQTQQIQRLRFYDEKEKIRQTDTIVDAISECADIITHAQQARRGLTKALYFVNTYFPLRDTVIKTEVHALLDELKNIPDTVKQNYRMRNTRNAAISLLYRLLNDWDEAIRYQAKTIDIIEKVDANSLNRNIPVISAYYNYISLFLNKGDVANSEQLLEKIKGLPVSGRAEERYLQAVILQLQLDHIVFNKDFSKIKETLALADTFLSEPHPISGIYHDTLIRLAACYIFTQDFSSALEKINLLMQSRDMHTLRFFPLHVRLMNILVHYELGNTLLLSSLIRNTYRYMLRQELQFATENIILNFFKRILNHINEKQFEREFKRLAVQLRKASTDIYERQASLSFFDYGYWLEMRRK